ncbi:MAG: sigma-70 family RNA polymerase sigma factor [Cytophagales bacterium]|nr:sigma-70 family RNA polymerase sigma factor [Cytophagales bacterium]
MDHINDDIIVDRILGGEEELYKILIDKYKRFAFTLAYNILNNSEEAEEAAQDSFIKAFRALAKFNRQAKFSTWLYRIVSNTAITYGRRNKVKKEDIELAKNISTAPAQNLEKQDQQRFLHQGLSRLGEQDRLVISLFYLKELSLEEIAGIMDIKASLVKVKLHRARKRLANQMQFLLREEALNL